MMQIRDNDRCDMCNKLICPTCAIVLLIVGFWSYIEAYSEPETRESPGIGYPNNRVLIRVGYPGTPYPVPNTRRLMNPTRTRTSSDRSGYSPPGTRTLYNWETDLTLSITAPKH